MRRPCCWGYCARSGTTTQRANWFGQRRLRPTGLRSECTKSLILMLAALACVVTMPAARGDDIDDLYIGELQTHGVGGDAATLIRIGHAACQLSHSGSPTRQVVSGLAQQAGLSLLQATEVASAAIMAYCPDQRGRFQNGM